MGASLSRTSGRQHFIGRAGFILSLIHFVVFEAGFDHFFDDTQANVETGSGVNEDIDDRNATILKVMIWYSLLIPFVVHAINYVAFHHACKPGQAACLPCFANPCKPQRMILETDPLIVLYLAPLLTLFGCLFLTYARYLEDNCPDTCSSWKFTTYGAVILFIAGQLRPI